MVADLTTAEAEMKEDGGRETDALGHESLGLVQLLLGPAEAEFQGTEGETDGEGE